MRHMLGNCAAAPENPECRAPLFWPRGQRDLGYDKTQQALAVDGCGRPGMPKRGQVIRQAPNVFPISRQAAARRSAAQEITRVARAASGQDGRAGHPLSPP